MVQVIPIGTEVRLHPDGLSGIVVAICIMDKNHIQYKCSYWNGNTE